MRKILFIFFLFVCFLGNSQSIFNRGSQTQTVQDARLKALLNFFMPCYADTGSANVFKGIDSCGAQIFTYDSNTVWVRACSPVKYWKKVGGGAATSGIINAYNGLSTTTVGSDLYVQLGGQLVGIIRSPMYNTLIEGGPQQYLAYYNRLTTDSLNGYGPFGGGQPVENGVSGTNTSPYGPSMISTTRIFAEQFGDTQQLHQYGPIQQMTQRYVLDSTGSIFGPSGTKKFFGLGDAGYGMINQFFPPIDSTDLAFWQDGMTGASFHSIGGLGGSWGYNAHVLGDFPWVMGFASTMDLMRENSRTRNATLTGSGVTSFLSNYRFWQQTMTVPGTEGHYIGSVAAFTDFGNTDTSIGPTLTKAEILARSEIDTNISLKLFPLWRAHNEVNNGVAIWQMGNNDVSQFTGYLNIGDQLPTVGNGQRTRFRFSLSNGTGYVKDSIFFQDAGYIYSQADGGAFAPGYVFLTYKDSASIIRIGNDYRGGYIDVHGKANADNASGGVNVGINYNYNATAPFRINFVKNDFSVERRYRFERKKASIEVIDSISLTAAAYKFNLMPRSTSSTWVLAYDSATKFSSFIPVRNILGATPGLQDVITANPQLNTSNTIDVNFNNLTWSNALSYDYTTLPSSNISTNIHQVPTSAALSTTNSGTGGSSLVQTQAVSSPITGDRSYITTISSNNNAGNISSGIFWERGIELTADSVFIKSSLSGASVGYVWTLQNTTTGHGKWVAASGGSMAIGGAITSATAGSVLYAGTNGLLQQSPSIFTWDSTNRALGVAAAGTANTYLLTIRNTTSGTASASNQMYGGFYTSEGQGWKTNATAASQAVAFRWGTVTIQGTTNPTGNLEFGVSVNGAAYSTLMTLTSGGSLGIGTSPVARLDISNGSAILGSIQTLSTGVNSNFFTGNTTNTTSTTSAPYLFPGGTNSSFRVGINGTTSSVQAAGHDYGQVLIGMGLFTEATSGTHPRAYGLAVLSPTITNGSAATDTLVGLYVQGPPTGVTAGSATLGLEVNRGDILFKYGTVQFGAYGAGTATFSGTGVISSVSDVRLKKDITSFNAGLKEVMNINPINFKWNSKSGMEDDRFTYAGFSAQNIKSALGDNAIGVNKDGYLSIQDRAIMGAMVNAIKEQQAMINDLRKEVKKLKKKR